MNIITIIIKFHLSEAIMLYVVAVTPSENSDGLLIPCRNVNASESFKNDENNNDCITSTTAKSKQQHHHHQQQQRQHKPHNYTTQP
jgi:hypothetical protein